MSRWPLADRYGHAVRIAGVARGRLFLGYFDGRRHDDPYLALGPDGMSIGHPHLSLSAEWPAPAIHGPASSRLSA